MSAELFTFPRRVTPQPQTALVQLSAEDKLRRLQRERPIAFEEVDQLLSELLDDLKTGRTS